MLFAKALDTSSRPQRRGRRESGPRARRLPETRRKIPARKHGLEGPHENEAMGLPGIAARPSRGPADPQAGQSSVAFVLSWASEDQRRTASSCAKLSVAT